MELQSWLKERDQHNGSLFPGSLSNDATSDTSLITGLMATFNGLSTEEAALQVLPKLRGAFSLVFMDEETLYAARDPQGIVFTCQLEKSQSLAELQQRRTTKRQVKTLTTQFLAFP